MDGLPNFQIELHISLLLISFVFRFSLLALQNAFSESFTRKVKHFPKLDGYFRSKISCCILMLKSS